MSILIREMPWIFIGRTDAEASILWPPDEKSWLIGKDPDAEKDWGEEEKGATGDDIIGRHHLVDGHEFEQILGDSEGQGSLACCSLWDRKELDVTEQQLSRATQRALTTGTTVTKSDRNHMTPGKGSPPDSLPHLSHPKEFPPKDTQVIPQITHNSAT